MLRRWYELNAYEIKMAILSLGLGGLLFALLWLGMAMALIYR